MTATTDLPGSPQRAGAATRSQEAMRTGSVGEFEALLDAPAGAVPNLAAVQSASAHIQAPLSILTSVPGGTAHRVVATLAYARDWK